MMKAILDNLLGKIASRKLLAWGTATTLALYGAVTSEDWVTVTLVYIGSQAAVDMMKVWKHGS
jgi:hypothetical protein